LAIDYTNDENIFALEFQNEFLFGDFILVAPVISTTLNANVYLPKGNWYRLSTDEKFKGGKRIVADAPLTDLPVFIKAGAIIPIQNVVQSTSEKGDGILELHIWNGTEATELVYYEDDGNSYDYQQGVYYKRVIRFEPAKKTVCLLTVEGTFISKYHRLKLVLHGFKNGLLTMEAEMKNTSIEIKY
jgi:alpha-glucosidase